MTDRNKAARNRSAIDLSSVIPWTNVSGETIPAYAVVQLRTDHDGVSKASKPDGSSGLFFASGMVSVAEGKSGESQVWSRPRVVLFDGSATVGDEVGPVAGQWYMSTEGTGFRVLLQPNEGGLAVVVQVGGGGDGLSPIRFEIREPDCDARMAICRVLSRNGSVPGEYEIYGETEENEAGETVPSKFVDVYDKVNAFFNESDRKLRGRLGYASYLYGRPRHEYDPWWAFEVTTLCEQQTECEAF